MRPFHLITLHGLSLRLMSGGAQAQMMGGTPTLSAGTGAPSKTDSTLR